MNNKIPYLVENKERDTFTIYVKGTKPYLELQQRIDKAWEWVIYKQQHSIEPVISTDELDDLLEILGDKE